MGRFVRVPVKRGQPEAGFGMRGVLFGVAAVAAILVLTMPEYLHGREHRNERSAIVQIRTIHKAEEMFFSKHKRFSGDLRELGVAEVNGSDGYTF